MSKMHPVSRTLAAGTIVLFLQGAASADTKVEGTAEALRIETLDSPIQEVLVSLQSTLRLQYRTSVQLDQQISGTYQGSLTRVLARVLDGYDYILKNSSENAELVVLGRKGNPSSTPPTSAEPGSTTPVELAVKAAGPNAQSGNTSGAAKTATPQPPQPSTTVSMLTALAEQQLPNAGSAPRSAATGTPTSSSSASVPSQAEIAALTQQAAGKLEALRSSLQRVAK
jgi:hypothetical protein